MRQRSTPRSLAWGAAALGLVLGAAVLTPTADAATPNFTRVVEHLRVGKVNHNDAVDQAMSSPTFGDVTGDGRADLVVGSMDGQITVLDPTSGTVLRSVVVQSGAMIQAAPVLVDVTGDGVKDVVTSTVRNVSGQSRVKIYDMVPAKGRVVFDRADSGLVPQSGFFGAPVVGDIDGDGALEVAATAFDHGLHAWELSGAVMPGFPVYTYDTTLSSAALADVDRDGVLDIVFGGDMDSVNQPLPPGGYLWAVTGTGKVLPGYPLKVSGEVLWSSVAVGDVDADGDLDAVVGTGRNFRHRDWTKLYAIDLGTRSPVAGWPRDLQANTMGSPALVDLDGDPGLEVITTTADGNVHRLDSNGVTQWRSCSAPTWQGCGSDYAYIGSPVVVDVDADAAPEIVVVGNRELIVLNADTGALEYRETIRSNPNDYAWPGAGAPAVTAIGSTTYVAAHVQVDNGDNVRRDGDRQGVYVWSTPGKPATAPWPHFQRDETHSGRALAPGLQNLDRTNYINAVFDVLLGRAATASEISHWNNRFRSGASRESFTRVLSRSSEWTGVVIDGLYDQVFARPPDSGGRAYWADLVSKGLRVSEVAAHFYGSDEWFHRRPPTGGGGTVEGFVDNLYRRILAREPDGNRQYWIDQVRGGTNRVTVATAFYLSYESNARRVDALYVKILKRKSDAAGRDHWARQFSTLDDVELAALLTASDEFLAAHP